MTATDTHVDDALSLVEMDRLEQQLKGDVQCSQEDCDKPAAWRVTTKPCGCISLLCDPCMDATANAFEAIRISARRAERAMVHRRCGKPFFATEADFDSHRL